MIYLISVIIMIFIAFRHCERSEAIQNFKGGGRGFGGDGREFGQLKNSLNQDFNKIFKIGKI